MPVLLREGDLGVWGWDWGFKGAGRRQVERPVEMKQRACSLRNQPTGKPERPPEVQPTNNLAIGAERERSFAEISKHAL